MGRSVVPGDIPTIRERMESKRGFTGELTVIVAVNFATQQVKRATITVEDGKIIRIDKDESFKL